MSRDEILTSGWGEVRSGIDGLSDSNIADAVHVANPSDGRIRRSAILLLVDGRTTYIRHEPGRGTVAVIPLALTDSEQAARRDGERDPLGLDPGEGDSDPLPFDVRRGRIGPR